MNKHLGKILIFSILLMLLLPAWAFAAETIASGTCGAQGDNLTWTLDDEGLLSISGVGEMADYSYYSAPWYSSRSSITSVTIAEGITSIGYGAFSSCQNLHSISIPSSVTIIGESAFGFCYNLQNIVIPEGVTSIGDDAFRYCSSLRSISVEDQNAYYSSLDGVLFNKNKTQLIRYPACKAATSYTIPEGVTSISDKAFSDCVMLQSIIIPSSVTGIGGGVFSSCSSMQNITVAEANTAYCSIDGILFNEDRTTIVCYPACKAATSYTIPASVTSIGDYAFKYCYILQSITIPSSVTSIGLYAFRSCSSLQSIIIPSSVTSIGSYAFYNCSKLDTVYYIGTEESWNSISIGSTGSANNDLTNAARRYISFVEDIKHFTIGEVSNGSISLDKVYGLVGDIVTVTAIPVSVSNYYLDKIYVDGEAIEGNTFIVTGDHVITADFKDATPEIIDKFVKKGIISNRENGDFDALGKITRAEMAQFLVAYTKNTVLSDALENVPSEFTDVQTGKWYTGYVNAAIALGYMQGMVDGTFGLDTTITYGQVVTMALRLAGYNDNLPGNWPYDYVAQASKGGDKSLVKAAVSFDATAAATRQDVVYIFNALLDWDMVKWNNSSSSFDMLTPAKTVCEAYGAFPYTIASGTCGAQGDNLTWTLDSEGLLTISGSGAMINPYRPLDVTWYSKHSSIIAVTIAEGVTSIGDYAFYDCSNLQSITIPSIVTNVGNAAFYSCNNLQSVVIPECVTIIGNSAFENCSNLQSISISSSVTNIGYAAFYSCNNLQNISVSSQNENYSSLDGVLFNKNKTQLICYPAGKTAASYSIPSSVTGIDSFVFAYCDNLQSITVPSSVTNIGNVAFYSCDNLQNISVSSQNENYSSLDGVLFNENITEIICYPAGKTATKYTIPSSVTGIGVSAFHYCTNLQSIIITSSVTSIGRYAFDGCSSLTKAYYLGKEADITIESGNTDLLDALVYLGDDVQTIDAGSGKSIQFAGVGSVEDIALNTVCYMPNDHTATKTADLVICSAVSCNVMIAIYDAQGRMTDIISNAIDPEASPSAIIDLSSSPAGRAYKLFIVNESFAPFAVSQ